MKGVRKYEGCSKVCDTHIGLRRESERLNVGCQKVCGVLKGLRHIGLRRESERLNVGCQKIYRV